MIARSAPPFTVRSILDRLGLASMQQPCQAGGTRPNLWQRIFTALSEWPSLSAIAWQKRNSLARPARAVPALLLGLWTEYRS